MESEDQGVAPFDLAVEDPDEGSVHLFWADRKKARLAIPKPRLLVPVPEESDPTEEDPGNLVIEGDNRQAMVSLLSQYAQKVDVVLIDPPYNTGRQDLRYSDARFADPDADTAKGDFVSAEDGGKHAKWLNQMAPTLRIIFDLMAKTGVIFIHIDDRELPRLLILMEEIFLEKNQIGTIIWRGATDNNPSLMVIEHEYIVVWARDKASLPKSWAGPTSELAAAAVAAWEHIKATHPDIDDQRREWTSWIRQNKKELPAFLWKKSRVHPRLGPYQPDGDLANPGKMGYVYDVLHPVTGRPVKAPLKGWRYPKRSFDELLNADMIEFGADETKQPGLRRPLTSDHADKFRSVVELDNRTASYEVEGLFPDDPTIFKNPKPTALEEHLLSFAAGKDALVLDCFAGSGTTGHAVMRLNKSDGGRRRFILIDEGTEGDPYATTMTAERLRRARTKENLPGGFTFLRVDQKIDPDALAHLQRQQLVTLIRQTDASGRGTRIRPIEGTYVIGANARGEAICLHFDADGTSRLTRDILRAMYLEAAELGLKQPLRVYATSSEVQTSEGFAFFKLPDEVAHNLALSVRGD